MALALVLLTFTTLSEWRSCGVVIAKFSALGELIGGQGRRRLSNGSQGAVSPTHNEVSVKGASVFTEDAHDGQNYSVPQRQ